MATKRKVSTKSKAGGLGGHTPSAAVAAAEDSVVSSSPRVAAAKAEEALKERTSVFLDKVLLSKLRVVSRLLGRSQTDIINEALANGLRELEPTARKVAKVLGKTYP